MKGSGIERGEAPSQDERVDFRRSKQGIKSRVGYRAVDESGRDGTKDESTSQLSRDG